MALPIRPRKKQIGLLLIPLLIYAGNRSSYAYFAWQTISFGAFVGVLAFLGAGLVLSALWLRASSATGPDLVRRPTRTEVFASGVMGFLLALSLLCISLWGQHVTLALRAFLFSGFLLLLGVAIAYIVRVWRQSRRRPEAPGPEPGH